MAAVVGEVSVEARAKRLAAEIRALRQERGMTQGELAAVLGVQHTAVSNMENRGVHNLALLEQAAWALDADVVIELRPRRES